MQIGQFSVPPLQAAQCGSLEHSVNFVEMTKTSSSTSNIADHVLSPKARRPVLSFSSLRVFSAPSFTSEQLAMTNGVFIPMTLSLPMGTQTEVSDSCFTICNKRDEAREELSRKSAALRQMLKESKAQLLEPQQKSQQQVPTAEVGGIIRKTKCNCKKSGCLKMYCDCFRQKGYCEDCNCVGCMNTPQFASARIQAMQTIKVKNPLAFESLVVVKPSKLKENENIANVFKPQHIKGCRCKRTNCRKKYCECFQLGVMCGPDCVCTGCQNCESDQKHHTAISHSHRMEPCTKMKIVFKECTAIDANL